MSHKKKKGHLRGQARSSNQTNAVGTFRSNPFASAQRDNVTRSIVSRDPTALQIHPQPREILHLVVDPWHILQTLKIATSRMRLRKTYLYTTEILVGARIGSYLADRS